MHRLRRVPRSCRRGSAASITKRVQKRLARTTIVRLTWEPMIHWRTTTRWLRHCGQTSGTTSSQKSCKPWRSRAASQGSQEGGGLLRSSALALHLRLALRLGLGHRRADCTNQLSLSWRRGQKPRKPRRRWTTRLRRRLSRSLGLARRHLGSLRSHPSSTPRGQGARSWQQSRSRAPSSQTPRGERQPEGYAEWIGRPWAI